MVNTRYVVNTKYSSESSWRDLQDLHTFAPWDSNLKTKKKRFWQASSGRSSRLRRRNTLLHLWNPWEKPWKGLCTDPKSRSQLYFVKHVRNVAVSFHQKSKCNVLFAIVVQVSLILMKNSGFSAFLCFCGKEQNLLDSQIAIFWDLAENIAEFWWKWYSRS